MGSTTEQTAVHNNVINAEMRGVLCTLGVQEKSKIQTGRGGGVGIKDSIRFSNISVILFVYSGPCFPISFRSH